MGLLAFGLAAIYGAALVPLILGLAPLHSLERQRDHRRRENHPSKPYPQHHMRDVKDCAQRFTPLLFL